jgi:hypothetical protein
MGDRDRQTESIAHECNSWAIAAAKLESIAHECKLMGDRGRQTESIAHELHSCASSR